MSGEEEGRQWRCAHFPRHSTKSVHLRGLCFSESLTRPHSQQCPDQVRHREDGFPPFCSVRQEERQSLGGCLAGVEEGREEDCLFTQPCRRTTVLYHVLYFVKLQTGCSQTHLLE